MKRGFTLLELIIVLIIIGVLATLGFMQYARMVEKSRGAEARDVLGGMRKLAYAYYTEKTTVIGITESQLGLGPGGGGGVPTDCNQESHYFMYSFTVASSSDAIKFTGTRCTSGGKPPSLGSAGEPNAGLDLNSNFATGNDTWESRGGY